MKKLLAALVCAQSLFLLMASGAAHAAMTRYQLTTVFPTSYFDYDTSTSTLGSFLIQHPAPLGPLNPAHTDPATSILVESSTQVHFVDTATTFDATYKYVWTLDFLANFHTDGSYDGTFGYGETLYKYRLSDDLLELTSVAPFGGDIFGFYSVGLAPVAAVPEPEAYSMLLVGLGLLGLVARRGKMREAAFAV